MADVDLTAASAQYEASFRDNRDDATENGYDLICPICGCAFNEGEPWEMNHDRPLHGVYDALRGVMADVERERVTALWREAVAALEEPSLAEIQSRAEAVLDIAASRAKIADAMGTLHVLQSRADRILNGHDDPSDMAHDIRRLRQEAHGHLVAARAALGVEGDE